jgi:hypothetical protein
VCSSDLETALSAEVLHSPYTSLKGVTYAIQGQTLGTLDDQAPFFNSLYSLPNDGQVWFDELNDEIVVSSTSFIGRLTGTGIEPIGVEAPGALVLVAAPMGGLDEGRYGCAISYVMPSGEEGPLSQIQYVDVAQGGGITFMLPTPIEGANRIRLYRTPAGGDLLYFATDAPLLAQFMVGNGVLGQQPPALSKARMLPGKYLKVWQGRLLVARGRTLYVSDPLRYGIVDLRHGFVSFQNEIVFIEQFPEGVYVGTKTGVYYLNGSAPSEWKLQVVDAEPPLGDASLVVRTDMFEKDALPNEADEVAVWLGGAGFHFGLPSGAVVRPQSDRINLSLYGQRGSLQIVDGVLTAVLFN